MTKINLELIKKLKEQTGAPVIRAKQVLEEVDGDEKKAFKILQQEGFEKAAKKGERETAQGLVECYVHHSGKVASMVEVLCETDFVARNELFKELAHNLAMQVASMEAKDGDDLMEQEFIKDPTKKISVLVKAVIAKTGENIRIGRIYRIELGK
jgi:elongation factor Ts